MYLKTHSEIYGRMCETMWSCSMKKFCSSLIGNVQFCSVVGVVWNVELNACTMYPITNELCSVSWYLLSMSGFPNSQLFTRRVTDKSFRINNYIAASTRTFLSNSSKYVLFSFK